MTSLQNAAHMLAVHVLYRAHISNSHVSLQHIPLVEIWTGGTRTRTQNVKLETNWVWGNYAEIANLVTA
jgi:hypothetical protein